MNDRKRFGKFTEQAEKVLSLAQEEAHRFQHNYTGPEHLLLGLLQSDEDGASSVLRHLGVELNQLRHAVEFVMKGSPVLIRRSLNPQAKKIVELAFEEALRLNHHSVGSEHLLLGIVRENNSIAAGILGSLGIDIEKVRTQTVQEVLSHQEESVEASPLVPPEAALLLRESEQALTCHHCGTHCPDDFHYCFNCGHKLTK